MAAGIVLSGTKSAALGMMTVTQGSHGYPSVPLCLFMLLIANKLKGISLPGSCRALDVKNLGGTLKTLFHSYYSLFGGPGPMVVFEGLSELVTGQNFA